VKVLVLAGGDSNEREVSFDSGAAICESLLRLGHEVRAIDPGTGQSLIDGEGRFLIEDSVVSENVPEGQAYRPGTLVQRIAESSDVDVVFLALHGGSGENGSIQNLLDLARKKYTGSGMTASTVAMNKALTKRIMTSVDVPTPKWNLYELSDSHDTDHLSREIAAEFGLPLIVKPNDGGSTIGLTKVTAVSELPEAIHRAGDESHSILIEEYIAGRELTVSVFDGKAYPVVEIKPVDGLYDYDAKYTKGKSEYVAPAEVDSDLADHIQQAAVRIYEAIGCAGLARVDFIMDETGRLYCLEVNTLPGMTALSLAPMALKCEGIGFDQLISMMIESALRK